MGRHWERGGFGEGEWVRGASGCDGLRSPQIMARPAPTAQEQLDFLGKIERLLSQGRFTSTYKFALLIALTNIAVERGDDTGEELEVELEEIARQYLALYWNMARPYPRVAAILKQNREAAKPSKMITLLKEEARTSQSSYQRLRVYRASRDGLVNEAIKTLAKNPIHCLQTIGKTSESTNDRFLFDHPATAAKCATLKRIVLKPGVSASLRRMRGIIVALVQSRWALWIRENNDKLAADRELESFLFGASRSPVSVYAERFYELQSGRCFYSGTKLAAPNKGEVDHFIPWARYPFDSPFNLVLASREVNNKMRDELKKPEWRERWLERNDEHAAVLVKKFGAAEVDQETVRLIAEWVYKREPRVTG